MTPKILFAIISTLIATYAFYPYVRDVIRKKTHPHIFTWIIWAITQGTAVTGMWVGGGGVGAIGFTVGTGLIVITTILAFKKAEKDITLFDKIILLLEAIAILIWWLLSNPIIAIFMVTGIDLVGYLPTFRKSYKKPYGETLSSWIAFTIANIFAIIAMQSYNLLTLTYISAITVANATLVIFLLVRRKAVK